jgi:hypothetical protein
MRVQRRKNLAILSIIVVVALLVINVALYLFEEYLLRETARLKQETQTLQFQIVETIERRDFLDNSEIAPYAELQEYTAAEDDFEEFYTTHIDPIVTDLGLEFSYIYYVPEVEESSNLYDVIFNGYNVKMYEIQFSGTIDSEATLVKFIEEVLDLQRTVVITNYSFNGRDEDINYDLTLRLFYLVDDAYLRDTEEMNPGSGDNMDYLTE